ncbi:MAG: hypothetical protein K8F25_10085, partial [Fimbriimonadaceae bacterium]|nr:hypothetical protein [Alphaproteobacteria bacterium]
MEDHKNTILAIALSIMILIVWQIFVGGPEAERQQQIREAQQQLEQQHAAQPAPGTQSTGQTTSESGSSIPVAPGVDLDSRCSDPRLLSAI